MMNDVQGYRKAFYLAICLHVLLAVFLWIEPHHKTPTMDLQAKAEANRYEQLKPQEIVKAVSINQQEVTETIQRLREEKTKQRQAEIARQNKLSREAEQAKQARLKEQKRIEKLKEEADKIAIAKKKQLEEEKRRLKELAEQKAKEEKRLIELKQQQERLRKKEEEARKLAELKKKQAEEMARVKKLKAEQEQAAREQAAREAEKQARMAGEVNKYKALIVNAISRQWILPENVDNSLSSKFRIRLAPDGMVLEVTLVRSSGDPVLDRSAQTAIYKASPLPVPSDIETFNLFRDISLTVRPEQVRG
ncbi:cell envelope integrity protein TolA [Legionella israelensis]|nr:cell envelope integrity protein TolA [Legionella israelensis]